MLLRHLSFFQSYTVLTENKLGYNYSNVNILKPENQSFFCQEKGEREKKKEGKKERKK